LELLVFRNVKHNSALVTN